MSRIKAYKIGNAVITLAQTTNGFYADVAKSSHSNLYYSKTAEGLIKEVSRRENIKVYLKLK